MRKRALRTSVQDDLLAEIEWYARTWNVSTAAAAERLLAAGVAFWEGLGEMHEKARQRAEADAASAKVGG
ncbi:MAG TPA: hypothetical protein VF082_12785 [Jiangellaceae bacterium]